MTEKLITVDPQIVEKLIQNIDGQTSLLDATLPVAIGAVIGVVAALAGNLLNDHLARRRQHRDLHREKLEEAIQALLSLRRWALASTGDVIAMSEQQRNTGETLPIEDWKKVGDHFVIEGQQRYEKALALLEIYSDIKCPGKELSSKLTQFENAFLVS